MSLLLFGACSGQENGRGADPGSDVVNIGYSGPLSGGAAYYGRNVQSGLQLAVDELNEAGGLEIAGRQVRFNLVSLDDQYLPNETATNARRLVQQSQAAVIFVPHAGGVLAVQGMNTRDPFRFLLMAYTSEPRILESANPLTVMIPPRYDHYAGPFTRTMQERFGKRLGILPTTTTYGRAWTEVVTKEWQAHGGTVGRNFGVDYNTTTDFSGVVSQVLAEKPDVLFLGGPSQPTALVVRAAREQGFKGGFLMMDQPKFEEMVTVVSLAELEGSVGVHPQESYPASGVPLFVANFRKRVGPAPVLVSEIALNYQAVHIAARAMALAGTTSDVDAIRKRIPEVVSQLPPAIAISDIRHVNELGHIIRQVYGAHVLDGKYVPLPIPLVAESTDTARESRTSDPRAGALASQAPVALDR
jgi:branched-chain amino acid transport system substrate-binding protein